MGEHDFDAPASVDIGSVVVVHDESYQVTGIRTQDDPLTPGERVLIVEGVRLPKPTGHEHGWHETTAYGDARRTFICSWCGGTALREWGDG